MYGMLRSSLRLQQGEGEAQDSTADQASQGGANGQQYTATDSTEEASRAVGTGQPSAPYGADDHENQPWYASIPTGQASADTQARAAFSPEG